MNQENTNRHLALELDDTKNSLVQTINTAIQKGVPCFLLEYIVAELHNQVHNIAEDERKAARREEALMLAKQQKEEAKDENN